VQLYCQVAKFRAQRALIGGHYTSVNTITIRVSQSMVVPALSVEAGVLSMSVLIPPAVRPPPQPTRLTTWKITTLVVKSVEVIECSRVTLSKLVGLSTQAGAPWQRCC